MTASSRKRPALTLYSTDSCRLCEEAFELLLSMPELQGLALRVVDVADDDDLLARYGAVIPVFMCGETALHWPFGAREVLACLRSVYPD